MHPLVKVFFAFFDQIPSVAIAPAIVLPREDAKAHLPYIQLPERPTKIVLLSAAQGVVNCPLTSDVLFILCKE